MKVRIGNVFDHVKTGVIIHGCNAQGVMGSGVAKDVKTRYPAAYQTYREHCELYGIGNKSLLGTVAIWTSAVGEAVVHPSKDLFIFNAITQLRYGTDNYRYVSYPAVQECFDVIYATCKTIGATEVHFPAIGSGLGGGDWAIISTIIKDSLQDIQQTLWLLDDV